MTGDQDVIRARLGDAGRDRADACFGDELDPDAGARIDRLEVVDQLCEVLDRVDVVVWWRRDELHARLRMPQTGDEARDFEPGQLAALARLRALRDLDLELVG